MARKPTRKDPHSGAGSPRGSDRKNKHDARMSTARAELRGGKGKSTRTGGHRDSGDARRDTRNDGRSVHAGSRSGDRSRPNNRPSEKQAHLSEKQARQSRPSDKQVRTGDRQARTGHLPDSGYARIRDNVGRAEHRAAPMAPSHPSEAYSAALASLPPLTETLPLPELLVPCGSEEIMRVAVQSGADAVYLGGRMHNARMNAHNFDDEAMRRTVEYCHARGVRVYVTLNTLLYDRELEETARYAAFLQECGVDALIVADPGICRLLHEALPDMELHASTQMSVHEVGAARLLGELGFSRVVPARELSLGDIRAMCERSGVEIEVFVHGALCVCRSGQCLFSSLVGGRSGNRGECAQPCRLPYNGGYPLSLRDLCLGGHMTELICAGIASLKIEGRMKSPTYIRTVTSIYRRLLDERRNATEDELCELRDAFSRSGFTDGYYVDGIDDGMLGVRSESDKAATAQLRGGIGGKNTGSADADKRGGAAGTDGGAARSIIIPAERRILSLHDILARQMSEAAERTAEIGANAEHARDGAAADIRRTARFSSPEQITERARGYFDGIALPLDRYLSADETERRGVTSVILPAAVHDSERDAVRAALSRARDLGCTECLVQGIGQLPLVSGLGFRLVGDFRFGVTNSLTPLFISDISALAERGAAAADGDTASSDTADTEMTAARNAGGGAEGERVHTGSYADGDSDVHPLALDEILLSPELTLPRIRDIRAPHAVIVYGRVPLMLLEHRTGVRSLTDRRGVSFPVRPEQRLDDCRERELIYNSVPVYMADRAQQLARAGIVSQHYIFSVESAREVDAVIAAYEGGLPPRSDSVRRIK